MERRREWTINKEAWVQKGEEERDGLCAREGGGKRSHRDTGNAVK